MNNQTPDARDILEDLLERTGQAIANGDFDLFQQCFSLPQEMETFEGRRLVTTIEEVRAIFDAVRRFQQKAGITQLVRHCIEAEYRSEDVIEATHESRLIAGDTLINRPYPVFSVLRRFDGVWKISSSQYAIVDAPELNKALLTEVVPS